MIADIIQWHLQRFCNLRISHVIMWRLLFKLVNRSQYRALSLLQRYKEPLLKISLVLPLLKDLESPWLSQ